MALPPDYARFLEKLTELGATPLPPLLNRKQLAEFSVEDEVAAMVVVVVVVNGGGGGGAGPAPGRIGRIGHVPRPAPDSADARLQTIRAQGILFPRDIADVWSVATNNAPQPAQLSRVSRIDYHENMQNSDTSKPKTKVGGGGDEMLNNSSLTP
ncbi:hypothetical protein BD626DRAFT_589059 [Schizophyllum amplum]|uniref:Uncharacterized protein n=1 Tax=Schizophyllum amplum TaxID=97359 RepID=A0A550BRU0_9AGAR|nr:hypothetical protein BD626DRAFT_589059 [Auriculariopsis ampla]